MHFSHLRSPLLPHTLSLTTIGSTLGTDKYNVPNEGKPLGDQAFLPPEDNTRSGSSAPQAHSWERGAGHPQGPQTGVRVCAEPVYRGSQVNCASVPPRSSPKVNGSRNSSRTASRTPLWQKASRRPTGSRGSECLGEVASIAQIRLKHSLSGVAVRKAAPPRVPRNGAGFRNKAFSTASSAWAGRGLVYSKLQGFPWNLSPGRLI